MGQTHGSFNELISTETKAGFIAAAITIGEVRSIFGMIITQVGAILRRRHETPLLLISTFAPEYSFINITLLGVTPSENNYCYDTLTHLSKNASEQAIAGLH